MKLLVLLSVVGVALAELCTKKVCEFHWEVTRVSTMTYFHKPGHVPGLHTSTYNVELDGRRYKIAPNSFRPEGSDDLIGTYAPDDEVVAAGGFPRKVVVINGQMPGPLIEVMEGSEVRIHITNKMKMTAMTVHYHGLYQMRTPFMDGVAYVAQCPILPRQTFTHRFEAYPSGSHWYHAHLETLRLDGLYGMFIVHARMPAIQNYYALIQDWWNHDGESMDILNPFDGDHGGTGELHLSVADRDHSVDGVQTGALNYDLFVTLTNGRGRGDDGGLHPLTIFTIKKNNRIRIRTVNAAMEYQYFISVDDHKLMLMAFDGYEVEPIEVTDFLVAPGETTDFEIIGDKPVANYWMRSRTIREGKDLDVKRDGIIREGLSIIRYEGAPEADPTSRRRICSAQTPCTIFNCPFAGYANSDFTTCMGLNDARSKMDKAQLDSEFGVSDMDFDEHFFNFNFAIGSSINSKKFVASKTHLYQPFEDATESCDDKDCTKGCLCTHMVDLPFNRTVQMIFSSLQEDWKFFAHHPIHVHGHGFAVVKVGYPSYDKETGLAGEATNDVTCDDKYCNPAYWNGARPKMNLVNPPVKDTILIPARGYVVIRFRTNNPGFWFVHCHTEQHVMDGMGMVFMEGKELIPAPPKNFPNCKDFNLSDREYEDLDTVKYGEKVNAGPWATEEEQEEFEEEEKEKTKPTPKPVTPKPEVVEPKPVVTDPKPADPAVVQPADIIINMPEAAPEAEDAFTTTVPIAIGTAFGLIFVGAIIAVVPMFCIMRSAAKKANANGGLKGHENSAF